MKKKTFTKTDIVLLLFLIAAVVCIFVRSSPLPETIEKVTVRDSIVRDTIRDTTFKLVNRYIIRYDTVVFNDTVNVYVPISRYEFKDSSYRFVVDGYNVKPILVETYPTTHYITTEKVLTQRLPPKRITSGISIGVGAIYGTKGVDFGVYVGYGLTINLNKK